MRALAGLALLSGLMFAAFAPLALAQTQQPITLASLQISIWPEFDRPSCLIILDGQLAPTVPLPAQLTVHMPAAAQAPNAVAVRGTGGGLLNAAYTTLTAGGDIIIKFTTPSPGFRVEYYDPALVISGESRSFAFRLTSDFAAAAVSLRVQEPNGARDLSGAPALTPAGPGQFGLNYDAASLGPVAAGGTLSADIRYAKVSSALSATAVASTTGSRVGSAGSSWLWVVGAAALGLVLVGGGVAWYVRNTVTTARPPARGGRNARQGRRQRAELARVRHATRQRSPSRPGEAAAGAAAEGAAAAETPAEAASMPATSGTAVALSDEAPAGFCTQCGQRHQPGDRFCRQCGAPVRE